VIDARPSPGNRPKRVLTASEAAHYLAMPVAAVRRMRIGEIKLGSSVRYDVKAIDLYLDQIGGLSSSGIIRSSAEAALEKFVQDSGVVAWSS
jgi:hypothetical protein